MAEANSTSSFTQMLAFDERTQFYVPTMTLVGGWQRMKESNLQLLLWITHNELNCRHSFLRVALNQQP